MSNKTCSKCCENKSIEHFYNHKKTLICRDCNNFARRQKYQNNEEYRKNIIKQSSETKHKKVIERQQIKEEEQSKIGVDNKKCRYCCEIKHKDRFRYNRLKCRDCERDEPKDKLRRVIRSRIWSALTKKKMHTIEYLGCNHETYIKWILYNNNDYNIENHGKEWHIDHVIPLYYFNLDDEDEQTIAFNWRNTMPLSVKENLSKNKKIIKEQIEQHLKQLINYHQEKNIDMPQKFIDLFAKHLVAGNP
jgi:hypothetical protein